MVKLFSPYVSWRSVWNVLRVLFSGQLAEGPEVKKFEEEFAAYHALPRCLAVNSGTSALELAAHLLDLKPDDEVIVPVFTCAATVVPFLRRCKVVLADIGYHGGFCANVSRKTVIEKITPKTKAVVFVSFGGDSTGLRDIRELCLERGLRFVHDAAQVAEGLHAHDLTVTSLQAIKTLTAGDGGFLVCERQADHERAKRLRWFGLERGVPLDAQDVPEVGYKYHMNDVAAAIGRGNLRALPALLRHRAKLRRASSAPCATPWLIGYIGEERELPGFEQGQHHYRLDRYSCLGEQGAFPNMDWLEGRYWFVPYGPHVSVRQAKKIGEHLKV